MSDYVFISYARDDGETFAKTFHDSLEADGQEAWLDKRDIAPGADWVKALEAAIEACQVMAFVMTPKSLESEMCQNELKHALDTDKPIIPLRTTESKELPFLINRHNWIDFHENDFAQGMARFRQWLTHPPERPQPRRILSHSGVMNARLLRNPDNVPERKKTDELYGRDDLMQQVRGLLQPNGTAARVLLHGFGGVGKTALAAEIVQQHLREAQTATDSASVLWLRAGTGNLEALLEAFLQALGIQAAAAQRQQALAQGLRQHDVCLLVLDDVWNGAALAQFIKLIPADVPLLATARQRYTSLHLLDVPHLDEAPALHLLADSSQGRADTDGSAERDLCRTLGYLPFAVELAGRNLVADNTRAADLLKRIDAQPHTLSVPEFEVDDATRRSVAALIETTLTALPDEAKHVYRAWGAFWSPQITPEMMHYFVTGKPDVSDEMIAQLREQFSELLDTSDEALRRFVRKTLLENTDASEARKILNTLQRYGLATYHSAGQHPGFRGQTVAFFRLHDLAFSYTTSQATDAMRQRALEACLTYTGRYNEPSLENFAALEPELANFMDAAEFAMQKTRYEDAERFAWNLYPVGGSKVLDYLGYYAQARDLLQMAAEAARQRGNESNRASHLMHLGLNYKATGQYREAIAYYDQARKISRAMNRRRSEGNALGNLGNAYRNLGEYETAIDYLNQALAISREIGDKRGEGNRLGNLGNVYMELKQYETAIDYHQQALAISREIADKRAEGQDLGNLGYVFDELKEYERAIDSYSQALAISRETGDRRGEANCLNNLAVAYRNLQRYDEAASHYLGALVIRSQLGVEHLIEQSLNNIRILLQLWKDDDPDAAQAWEDEHFG